MNPGRIAQRIHGCMNLGAQASLAAPDGLFPAPFARSSTVLMRANDGRIDHRVFVIGIPAQMLEQPLPHATFGTSG